MRKALIISAILVIWVGSAVLADGNTNSNAVITLNAITPSPHRPVCEFGGLQPCSTYQVHSDRLVSTHTVYIIVAHGDSSAGVGGVSFGVELGPSTFAGFESCADMELPSEGWPASGTGNQLTWNVDTNCQRNSGSDGVKAIIGAFFVFAYADSDYVKITSNNTVAQPKLSVTDCSGVESEILAPGGMLGFLSLLGFNPCLDSTPVEPSTWSKIKARYGN